jgi:Ulp1 family protease
MDGVNCGVHVLHNAEILLNMLPANGIDHLQGFVGSLQEMFRNVTFQTRDAKQMREKLKENILETEAYFQRYGGE